MGSVLQGLIKLQGVENRLRASKAQLARCRRNVIIQENQVRTLQSALEAKKEEIQLTTIQSDRLELELKTKDAEISKVRASLNTAKTNKEYAALLTQLNTTKADNSKVESQILDLMKDIDADKAECAKIQQQIDEQKLKLEQVRKDSEQHAVKHEADIELIQAEWNEAAKNVEPMLIEVFNRVAETYDGEALAAIEQQHGKNGMYSCGGCFMAVTAESVNMLLTRDEIIRCSNCTRILVLSTAVEQI